MPDRFDEIRTERLLLRRWRDSDREPFAALNGDGQTMQFFPATMDRAASDALVDRSEMRFHELGYGLWALELAATGEFLGFTGLNPIPAAMPIPVPGGTEVGWRLRKEFWHHGYATEAARAAVQVGFTGAGLAEIWSFTAIRNVPSQAVMRRLGMSEHGFFEHPSVPEHSPLRPHVLYRLGRADWSG
jgi:RimJ/RimL family protein N-acetyltransferase